MGIRTLAVTLCVLAAAVLSSPALAEDLNIDISKWNGTPAPTVGAAAGQPGTWNSFDLLDLSGVLVDLTGAPTGVSYVFSSGGAGFGETGARDGIYPLMEDMLAVGFVGNSYSMAIGGLSDGTYDVYLYDPWLLGVGTGRGTVNGVPFAEINGSFNGTFAAGVNYHRLRGVVVIGGELTVVGNVVSDYTGAGLAGMQLVQTSVAGCPAGPGPCLELTCPSEYTLECGGPGGTPLELNFRVDDRAGEAVTLTVDVDGTNEQTTIIPAGTPPTAAIVAFPFAYNGLGSHTVDVTVSNTPSGLIDTCSFLVTLEDTQAPVLTLTGSSPQTVECGSGPYGDPGFSAIDTCEGDVTSSVVVGGDTVNTNKVGQYVITYNVGDASGNDADQVIRVVNVVDTTPPVIACNLLRTMLWPARNGLLTVGLSASATDNCPGSIIMRLEVFSDEGHGAAPFAPDATGNTAPMLRLRAQRAYPGDGRVYLLRITARDPTGLVSVECKSVVVPILPVGSWILQAKAQAAAAEANCAAPLPLPNVLYGFSWTIP